MKCHMVFDIKMEDFRRKARLVTGSYKNNPPISITNVSVVSGEIVCVALTIASQNDLEGSRHI